MAAKKMAKKKATESARPAAKKAAARSGARAGNAGDAGASKRIDTRIRELRDWRGETLDHVRRILKKAAPDVVEEWKWAKATSPGVPVWSHDGIICTGETYKDKIKLTFAKGASLKDPAGLFNSSLDGNVRRAIDIRESDPIDEAALTELVRAAVALNLGRAPRRR